MVVTGWLSVRHHLAISDDQVESRLWWMAGGSNHTFAAESPDECALAVVGVTPQSSLFINKVARRSLEGVPQGGSPVHILKCLLLALGKRGAARAALLIPWGIMNILEKISLFFHFLSFSFLFFPFLCSFGTPLGPLFLFFSYFFLPFFLFVFFFFFLPSSVALITITAVISWFSVGHRLVIIDDQVESRFRWAAGGSSPTFVPESPDECALAVVGVTPQSSLFISSLFTSHHHQCLT